MQYKLKIVESRPDSVFTYGAYLFSGGDELGRKSFDSLGAAKWWAKRIIRRHDALIAAGGRKTVEFTWNGKKWVRL